METKMKEMNKKLLENPSKDDDNFDEAIPIQIMQERTTEAYKDNTNEDIKTIEKKMKIVHKYFKKLNGEQYMRLQIKIILKIQIYFRLFLSNNVNYVQTNHRPYRMM